MQKHSKFLPSKSECKNFTLFLDRDGVMNNPIVNDYAKKPDDLIISDGVVPALKELKSFFGRVIMVTNQQGVHKKVMSETDLENVHLKLYNALKNNGVEYFNAAFFAPYLKRREHDWRKPSTGMPTKATEYFPSINLSKSIMVGDSPSDMKLADNIGAIKVRITNPQFEFDNQDFQFDSLKQFSGQFH